MVTRSGLGVALAAVAAVVYGWWWHYEELVVFGAAALVAVVLAVVTVRFGTTAEIQRHTASPRVARGEAIRLRYRATNPHRRRMARFTLVDACDDETLRVEVPPVASRGSTEVGGTIATHRRGIFPLGPCRTVRTDPFGLAIDEHDTGLDDSIIIHPRVYALDGPYGALHSADDDANVRTATADPLSGFVSLREYVDGDDPRLIHWPTSARMGTLMLRETVELRRPEFTIVVDTAEESTTPDDFEEAVDVAASLAVDALSKGIDVRLRTTDRERTGPARALRQDAQLLDFLTVTRQTPATQTSSVIELFQRGGAQGKVIIVTGASGPSSTFTDVERSSVIRIGAAATAAAGIAMAATDAREFSRRWRP